MALIIDDVSKVFDTSQINKGALLYARHKTWPEGRKGFVTSVCENELAVQYHPGIGNITNHFFLPAKEVAAGEWEVRWSDDLKTINEYPQEVNSGDA